MSLEELLRNRAISRIRPSHKLAQNTISRARRDVDTAKTLVANEKFDWSLAASYTYVLKVANEDLPSKLAFKGGTCLKKVYLGKTGRFSMDLDFTGMNLTPKSLRERLAALFNNREHFQCFRCWWRGLESLNKQVLVATL